MLWILDRPARKAPSGRWPTAVACAALALAPYVLAPAPLHGQQARRAAAPQIAANEPGSALLAPGAALAPKGGAAVPEAHAPGAALAPGTAFAPGGAQAAPGGEPSNAELNEALLYEREPPTRVRIAILNATGKPTGAAKVAVLLGDYRRRPLEDKIGLKIELVNISAGYEKTQAPAVVYYRTGFLRAALILARAIPGDTIVAAMRPAAQKRAGVDVEVVVGEERP